MRLSLRLGSAVLAFFVLVRAAPAGQIDIVGPPGSYFFGRTVTGLPSGNFVVTDPAASNGPLAAVGAVYLYDPAGNLISALTGSADHDGVGSGGIVLVGNGNFVVVSPRWANGSALQAGAVTWVDGSVGLSGVVSNSNSLVGTLANDNVGYGGVTVLKNGNYVVSSYLWNGAIGAATWSSGESGVIGEVSANNSLLGAAANDEVSDYGVVALTNGNFVVVSAGYATWGNGASGAAGTLSALNSLVSASSDFKVWPLTNGNYVVTSPSWNWLGAATWGDGSSGVSGSISSSNSLVGSSVNDRVGESGIAALSDGNYVVGSPYWNGDRGAATWGNGTSGVTGAVSTSNSIVGSSVEDQVGSRVTALCDGHYMIGSPNWKGTFGAATWVQGSAPSSGAVSTSNSLVGSHSNDQVGMDVTLLSNCNYVVSSYFWNGFRGAATWGDGSSGLVGVVTASNSFVGSVTDDETSGALPLKNGNYLVGSNGWGGASGAVTWCDGAVGRTGMVSAANSLVGANAGDAIGFRLAALSNGDYVVVSPSWNGGIGAVTWGNGRTGMVAVVSAANSLVGAVASDELGSYGAVAFSDGNYAINSPAWNSDRGAITIGNGAFRQAGVIQASNSVTGTNKYYQTLPFAYDPTRHQLVVGRPADNIVSLITMDEIFAARFE